MNCFFTMSGARQSNIIKDILRKELNFRRIEFDFNRIGAPSVLAGSSEAHLKNTVYYVKQGTCWKPVEFRDIIQAFNEALGELNAELERENKPLLNWKEGSLQSRISSQLHMYASRISDPIGVKGKVVLIFSNKFLLIDKETMSFELREPDQLELWSRTSLPYEYAPEFQEPLGFRRLRESAPGENPVLDWLVKTSGGD